jgi:hypothetical protein
MSGAVPLLPIHLHDVVPNYVNTGTALLLQVCPLVCESVAENIHRAFIGQ